MIFYLIVNFDKLGTCLNIKKKYLKIIFVDFTLTTQRYPILQLDTFMCKRY